MSSSENLVIRLIHALVTSPEALEVEVRESAAARPSLSQSELAEAWADRIVRLFTSEEVVSALPGAIPGLGTAARAGVEATVATGMWCGVMVPVKKAVTRVGTKVAGAGPTLGDIGLFRQHPGMDRRDGDGTACQSRRRSAVYYSTESAVPAEREAPPKMEVL